MSKSKDRNLKKPITVFNQPFEIHLLLNIDGVKSKLEEVDSTRYSFAHRFDATLLEFDGQGVFAIRLGQRQYNTWFIGLIEETPNGVILAGQIGIGIEIFLPILVGIALFVIFLAAFFNAHNIAALLYAIVFLGLSMAVAQYSISWQRRKMKETLERIFSDNYVSIIQ